MHPTLQAEMLVLLEAKILAGKQRAGRPGMDLWQILVLGVGRPGLDADWDRLEHIANDDRLVRLMLGLPAAPWDDEAKRFGLQTLQDNVALLDEALLQEINARMAAAGRAGFGQENERQEDETTTCQHFLVIKLPATSSCPVNQQPQMCCRHPAGRSL